MSHNKMYRYIKGYEQASYLASDVIDETDELIEMISYGKNYIDVIEQIEKIESIIYRVKEAISDGKGKKIED